MHDRDLLARRFEEQRDRLRAVAYRMLGSPAEADDAVQETWLRLDRSEPGEIDNLDAWLTTVVARICLNMLRARKSRREEPLEMQLPDPVVTRADGVGGAARPGPEEQALLADSVSLALLVVLETLAPAERLAFVLHDLFAVPFDEIARMVDRTPAAARQLASRARRRVQTAPVVPDSPVPRQREVVDAFLVAARSGDVSALVEVLAPDVVLRADSGPGRYHELHGAEAVASSAASYRREGQVALPVLVNGAAGVVNVLAGRPVALLGFTVVDGRIAAIDILADPRRLAGLDLGVLGG